MAHLMLTWQEYTMGHVRGKRANMTKAASIPN